MLSACAKEALKVFSILLKLSRLAIAGVGVAGGRVGKEVEVGKSVGRTVVGVGGARNGVKVGGIVKVGVGKTGFVGDGRAVVGATVGAFGKAVLVGAVAPQAVNR